MPSKRKSSRYDNGDDNEVEYDMTSPPDFDAPGQIRTITDPCCSFLLLVLWFVVGFIGKFALENGDPSILVHPSDYKGRNCGVDYDDDGSLLPNFYHPVDVLGNGVCVDECPRNNEFSPMNKSEMVCKDDTDLVGMLGCSYEGEIEENINMLVVCGGCMYKLDSMEAMNYCVPVSLISALEQVDVAANRTGFDPLHQLGIPHLVPYLERFARDIWTAREVVVTVGLGGSVLVGFIFLVFLRIKGLVATLVWSAAILSPVFVGYSGYYCQQLYQVYIENPEKFASTDHLVQYANYASYVLYAISALMVCILVSLRRKIMLAVCITKAASRAVIAFPFSVFYPIIQLFAYAAVVILWCILTAFLLSLGRSVEYKQEVFSFEYTYKIYEYDDGIKYRLLIMLFALFWTSEFILAMGQITLAMCYSKWYFTLDKKKGVRSSVLHCMVIGFTYHCGTAAFGSLVLASIRLVRSFMLWLHRKIKDSGLDNQTAEAVFCCCRCCASLLETCLRYLSKNAYIQTAMFSRSFCKASQESFFLIFRHATRMFAIGFVSELSMIYCKLFIVSSASVASYYVLEEYYGTEIYSVLSVVIVVAFFSWFIANMFLEVLGIAISTILQCFLADEEMNPEGSYFVPKDLDAFLQQVDEEESVK